MLLLSVLAGCNSTGGTYAPGPSAAATDTAVPSGAAAPAAATPAAGGAVVPATQPAAGAPATADYRISPLDILDISVFQVPDLTKTVQVSSTGQITMPLIGAVQAAGRTVDELQKDIADKLGAKYLQSPQVSVFVKEYTSQRYTVDGSVTKPGIYPMTGSTTLIQAIATAGGIDRVADPRGIVVFRQNGGKKTAAMFNLSEIRAGRAVDPPIYGGDVIVVDQSGMKATLRNVRESLGIFGLFMPLL
jgi:polysaccharide export outer membrane protein